MFEATPRLYSSSRTASNTPLRLSAAFLVVVVCLPDCRPQTEGSVQGPRMLRDESFVKGSNKAAGTLTPCCRSLRQRGNRLVFRIKSRP